MSGKEERKMNGKVTRIIKCSWHDDDTTSSQSDFVARFQSYAVDAPGGRRRGGDWETRNRSPSSFGIINNGPAKGSAKLFNFPPLYGNGFSEYVIMAMNLLFSHHRVVPFASATPQGAIILPCLGLTTEKKCIGTQRANCKVPLGFRMCREGGGAGW